MRKPILLLISILILFHFTGCEKNESISSSLHTLTEQKISEIYITVANDKKVLTKVKEQNKMIVLLNSIHLKQIDNPNLVGFSYVLYVKTESGQSHMFVFHTKYFGYEIKDKNGKVIQQKTFKAKGDEIDQIGDPYGASKERVQPI